MGGCSRLGFLVKCVHDHEYCGAVCVMSQTGAGKFVAEVSMR